MKMNKATDPDARRLARNIREDFGMVVGCISTMWFWARLKKVSLCFTAFWAAQL
jgi:hypothetical protein